MKQEDQKIPVEVLGKLGRGFWSTPKGPPAHLAATPSPGAGTSGWLYEEITTFVTNFTKKRGIFMPLLSDVINNWTRRDWS